MLLNRKVLSKIFYLKNKIKAEAEIPPQPDKCYFVLMVQSKFVNITFFVISTECETTDTNINSHPDRFSNPTFLSRILDNVHISAVIPMHLPCINKQDVFLYMPN